MDRILTKIHSPTQKLWNVLERSQFYHLWYSRVSFTETMTSTRNLDVIMVPRQPYLWNWFISLLCDPNTPTPREKLENQMKAQGTEGSAYNIWVTSQGEIWNNKGQGGLVLTIDPQSHSISSFSVLIALTFTLFSTHDYAGSPSLLQPHSHKADNLNRTWHPALTYTGNNG